MQPPEEAKMEADTNLRTIGCRVEKLIPDAQIVADIRTAVQRVHQATIHATALVKVHPNASGSDGGQLFENDTSVQHCTILEVRSRSFRNEQDVSLTPQLEWHRLSVAGPIPSNADSIAVRCKKVVPSAGNVTIDRQVALWTDECLVIELQVGVPEATAGACL